MPTLLEYLSTVDPDLDRTNVKKGPNTFNGNWDLVEETAPWSDFTYDNLIAMLGDVLTHSYPSNEFDTPAPIRRATQSIVDESTVTSVLVKWNHTIVDRALELAANTNPNIHSVSWALGTHSGLSGEQIFPDWTGIDPDTDFPARGRVPGDTKVSGKWSTSRQYDIMASIRHEFFKPLSQVVHYAKLFNTRYAYVISDKEVVCIRRAISEYEGSPMASNRQSRTQPPTTPEPSTPTLKTDSSPPFRVVVRKPPDVSHEHLLTPQRNSAPFSTASTPKTPSVFLSSPSNVHSSPSAYTDDGNPEVNEGPVQIAVIPWGESRPQKLTINLALFWLHILATFDTDLRSSYPSLGRRLAVTYGMLLLYSIS